MFLIIDGSSLLNIQYHGQKNVNENERKTGSDAVIEQIINILKKYPVIDHCCVVLDASRTETFRRQMYESYKAQRAETEEELKKEKVLLKEKLDRLGIVTLMHPIFEADDFAGTLSHRFSKEDKIILMTRDQDYLQLIENNVCLWLIKDEQTNVKLAQKYGINGVVNTKTYAFGRDICFGEYGIYPEQIPDYKGICGDSSDNIPGIKGVGPKVAIPLLQYYKTLETIIFELETKDSDDLKKEWKTKFQIGPSKVDKMIQGTEAGLLSKRLATIYKEIPNHFSYQDFLVPKL